MSMYYNQYYKVNDDPSVTENQMKRNKTMEPSESMTLKYKRYY